MQKLLKWYLKWSMHKQFKRKQCVYSCITKNLNQSFLQCLTVARLGWHFKTILKLVNIITKLQDLTWILVLYHNIFIFPTTYFLCCRVTFSKKTIILVVKLTWQSLKRSCNGKIGRPLFDNKRSKCEIKVMKLCYIRLHERIT